LESGSEIITIEMGNEEATWNTSTLMEYEHRYAYEYTISLFTK